ncbi:MAG: shikimate kinase, partial [Acidimicrobiia bacterium]
MTARHVFLVGLMGAGKTTVGAVVAEHLGRPFIDTDDVVEATTGRSVTEMFAAGCEPEFRELERQAVAD